MARVLIIGCGCRGTALATALSSRGHLVRGSTRRPDQLEAIERAGAEAVLADPDRVATLAPALAQTTVVVVLLGSAVGTDAELRALHGPRLEMLLTRILDAPVRGFVYEHANDEVTRDGGALVTAFCERSHIPFALLSVDGDPVAAVEAVLA